MKSNIMLIWTEIVLFKSWKSSKKTREEKKMVR